MPDKLLFDVLGQDGASAIERAIEGRPGLAGAVRPRAALAWAQLALTVGYRGPAPGSPEIHVDIRKGEGWVFGAGDDQVVGLEDSAPHLAACILANSGGSIGQVPRTKAMQRLGANLDAMAKAELTKAITKPAGAHVGVEAPGPAAAARPPKPPTAPAAPTPPSRAASKPAVAAAPKVVGAKPIATAPKPPKAPTMKAEGQKSKLQLPGFTANTNELRMPRHRKDVSPASPAFVPPKKPWKAKPLPVHKNESVKLTKAELQRPCSACDKPQLVGEDLIGCGCFCDALSKSEIAPVQGGFAIRFSDPEVLITFLEAVGHA